LAIIFPSLENGTRYCEMLIESQLSDRSVSVPMTLSDLERRDARVPLFCHLTNGDHIRHGNPRGEGRFLGVRHSPSKFWGSLTYAYTHWRRKTKNRLHNTHGEGLLHKCVARFVSDSWVSC